MARYLVSNWAFRAIGAVFPWGTLIVNVAGSFLLAIIMVLAVEGEIVSPRVRLALGTGLMGGFTTYSTFNYETMAMLSAGAWGFAGAYLVVTLAGCLVGGWLGMMGARLVVGG